MLFNEISNQAKAATKELVALSNLTKGDIFVVGCSTSEICGEKIGTSSNLDVAKALFDGIYPVLYENGIYLAAQCCEHLNRALITDKELARNRNLTVVNVIPQPKAGGSFATVAYNNLANPCAVEFIKAQAGIDIGGVLIGMHLKETAVPVRLSISKIGEAPIICARTRPKFIGGIRAVYDEELL